MSNDSLKEMDKLLDQLEANLATTGFKPIYRIARKTSPFTLANH